MSDPSAGASPPAPGWWLASDGNWYPPQARPGGPPPGPGEAPAFVPGSAPGPFGPAGPYGPPPSSSSTGKTVGIVIGVVVASFFGIALLSILAITFLGEEAEQKFESVGTAIDQGGGFGEMNSDPADGFCDSDRLWQDPDC